MKGNDKKMETNDMRKSQTVPFHTIKSGKAFIDEDDDIMMKIEDDLEIYNAVNLANGCVYTYSKNHLVTPINRVVIER